MIEYIDTRLRQWEVWSRSGKTHLGYPRQSPFVRLMPSEGGGGARLPDEDGLEMERAVAALEAELKAVVLRVYREMKSCTGEQIARDLGIHRDTLYARLHRAHQRIWEWIEDQELARGEWK